MGTGTKVGKTTAFAQYLIEKAAQGARCAWIGPVYKRTETGFNYIADAFEPLAHHGLAKLNRNALTVKVTVAPGVFGEVICFSGENPDAIYGDAFDEIVIDEGTRQPESVWIASRTTVTATGGRIRVAFNVDKGMKQWAIREFLRAKSGQEPTYGYVTMPTVSSPYVPIEEVEQARRTLPDRVFAALYEAQVQDDGAAVFTNHYACRQGSLLGPSGMRSYIIGVDVARKQDWTVVVVMDRMSRHVVHFDRFFGLPWKAQIERIVATARKYNNAMIACDATGVGDVVVEMIARAGIACEPVVFTSPKKMELVERLMVAFQRNEISIPTGVETEVIYHELDNFEYQVTPSGAYKYAAAEGYHDDCVCALALANYHLSVQTSPIIPKNAADVTWRRDLPANVLTSF